VHAAFGEVRLAAGARVTLTSETGEIPITLERTHRRRHRRDHRGGVLHGPAMGRRPAPAHPPARGQLAHRVLQHARAVTGTFPVTVSVWDPTREVLLDSTILSVRSTAISRTALLVIAGVVVVLLLIGEVRRRRQPRLEVVP
jgi:hypothetical protein